VVKRLFLNESGPMLVTEVGIVRVVRALYPNANSPMVVTEFGIERAVRNWFENARFEIAVTEYPPSMAGMRSEVGQAPVQPVTVAAPPSTV